MGEDSAGRIYRRGKNRIAQQKKKKKGKLKEGERNKRSFENFKTKIVFFSNFSKFKTNSFTTEHSETPI